MASVQVRLHVGPDKGAGMADHASSVPFTSFSSLVGLAARQIGAMDAALTQCEGYAVSATMFDPGTGMRRLALASGLAASAT